MAGERSLKAPVARPARPSITSGSSVNAETKIYDVLQAAVTVIWCISIVILFVDILIILRRFQAQFQARRAAGTDG